MTVVTARLGLPKVEGSDSARDYLKGALAGGGLHRALDLVDGLAAGAYGYHGVAQAIANATTTVLALSLERFDTDVIHDVAVSNSRLTCRTAGKYQIGANVAFASAAGGVIREAVIRLNGSPVIGTDRRPPMGGGFETILLPHVVYDLIVGDYVEVVVYQDSGAALNVQPYYSGVNPAFWMHRLG